jgi:hypothetical protein
MNDPSSILPDEIQADGYRIRLLRREAAIGAQIWVAVAQIYPPTVGELDFVLGYGATEYDAHVDAFARAKEQVRMNPYAGRELSPHLVQPHPTQ